MESSDSFTFDELVIDYSAVPPLKEWSPRDKAALYYRYYPSEADRVVILIHGSGWHSRSFLPLAESLSSGGTAHVYTPDLRGHGESPERRGDIDYIRQLEDDLADFISMVHERHPDTPVVLGGHSSGGGLVVRFAGCRYAEMVDGWLLLAPYLKYNAPTANPKSDWARPYTPRIIGLSMLNNIGVRFMNFLPVIEFNLPKDYRDGTETLFYTHRMNTGYAPRRYKKDLSEIAGPALLLAGTEDESFRAEKYKDTVTPYAPGMEVKVLQGVTHMGVIMGEEVRTPIKEWLDSVSLVP